MPEFTITRRTSASASDVWAVLNDFGDIQRWAPGVRASSLETEGTVGKGTMRHCAFKPFGSVREEIERYIPNQRMTVKIFDPKRLPMSGAVADFSLSEDEHGSEVTLHYRYESNRSGGVFGRLLAKMMRQGIEDMLDALIVESKGLSESSTP